MIEDDIIGKTLYKAEVIKNRLTYTKYYIESIDGYGQQITIQQLNNLPPNTTKRKWIVDEQDMDNYFHTKEKALEQFIINKNNELDCLSNLLESIQKKREKLLKELSKVSSYKIEETLVRDYYKNKR